MEVIVYGSQKPAEEPTAIVSVEFLNHNNQPVNVAQIDPTTGEAEVLVQISILDPLSRQPLPISKSYVVPYKSAIDGRQKGAVFITTENGQGSKLLKFSKFQTGLYIVDPSEILDASTMTPIQGVKFEPDLVRLAIVE